MDGLLPATVFHGGIKLLTILAKCDYAPFILIKMVCVLEYCDLKSNEGVQTGIFCISSIDKLRITLKWHTIWNGCKFMRVYNSDLSVQAIGLT